MSFLEKLKAALSKPAPSKKEAAPVFAVASRQRPYFYSPAYEDMQRFFGPAGGPLATSGRVNLSVPFRLAWDISKSVNRFSCHTLLAPSFESIFKEAVEYYGEKRFKDLRLDVFGGCFANRPMRGGTKASVHSWGAAVDMDPEKNQLKWTASKAAFAAPEYEAFWKIVEAHGAVSLGRERNFDWMHFQFCKA